MKTRKMFLVALLLLAVLTVGAVSASESTDELAVEDAGELSVDEAPADVVGNDSESTEISPDDVTFHIRDYDYSTENSTPLNNFGISAPDEVNGMVSISSNGQEYRKGYNELDEMMGARAISPKDVPFLKDLETNDLVSFSFLVEETPIKICNYKFIRGSSDGFRLNSIDTNVDVWNMDIWSWNEGDGPLYLDYDGSVINIDVWNQDMTGVFYASVNGTEYKFFPNFDSDDGHARHNWKLDSFDITDEDEYPVVVEYAVDEGSPRVVIHRGMLNVTRFNNDVFRATVDTENHINVFCPDNHEATILIFVKKDGDEDPVEPAINYPIQEGDKGNWKSWTFEKLGCEQENGYEFWVNVTNNGEELLFSRLHSYYGDPWQIEVTPEVCIDVWRNFYAYDGKGNILEIYVPEKAQVYNGTIEIRTDDGIVFTKNITARDMNFDDNSRDYRYGLPVDELGDMLSNVCDDDVLTFIFKYDDNQVSEPFYFITKDENGFNLEKMYDLGYWDVESDGPLYLDCNQGVINLDVHSQAMNGIFYVSANGTEYRYSPYFGEEDNAWHNWVLSSFGITDVGLYQFTIEYVADSESPRIMLLNGKLNVTRFENDTFRATEDRATQVISIFCPDGSEGAEVIIELKHDWEDEVPYQTVKTLTVTPEHYNKWIEFNFNELGFETDCDNIVRVSVSKDNAELMHPYVTGIWYEDDYYYELFIPNEIIISINDDEFEEGNEENTFLELYVPETTMFYNGTIEIKSGDIAVIDTTELSTANMEFNEDGRCYQYSMEFGKLNLEDLKDGDILTCTFIYEGKTVTKSFFYLMRNDEDRGEFVQFSFVNFKKANLLRDEVIIEIADFPDGVEDEFEIVIDKWGEKSTYAFNCSELVKDAAGIYTFRCSAFDYAEWMWDMDEVDYEVFVIFNRDGEKEEFNENPIVYKNPDMHHGEITIDQEWGSVIYFMDLDDLRQNFDADFIVNVTQNGQVLKSLTINLNDMDEYKKESEDGDEEYWIGLNDLGITENGEYNITIEFTKGAEKVQYNSTISVVDFVIDVRRNVEQINDPVFRILLEKEDSGTVAIYVNDTIVFNGTLEDIGFSNWNRMGGYNIPVNYLNITQSGSYEIRLEVNSTKGNRTVIHDINMVVGENTFDFRDLIYGYGEDNFVISNLTTPVSIDSEFVLYLNGREADRIAVDTHEFRFENLDKSFLDEFNNLKAGSYEAIIELVSNGQSIQNFTGSFKVWDRNGTVSVSVPDTLLVIDDAYISFSANLPDIKDRGPLALFIYIDPFLNDEWGGFDCADENKLEFRGNDMYNLLDGKTHKVSLNRCLSEGTHKIFVQYVYDEWEQTLDHDFFTGLFAVNVQKVGTKLSGSAVKATYNVAKNLVVTFKDANNNIMAGKKVTIKVGTISKTLTTNNKGQIVVDISKLVPKTYSATIKFAGDGTYKASSLTVKVVVNKAKPVFATKKVNVKAKTKVKKIKITFKHNKKGVKGKLITLKIKGKTYKAKTNNKGVATFKVKKLSKKGKYTGKLKFKGDKYYKGISGKVKVIVK